MSTDKVEKVWITGFNTTWYRFILSKWVKFDPDTVSGKVSGMELHLATANISVDLQRVYNTTQYLKLPINVHTRLSEITAIKPVYVLI